MFGDRGDQRRSENEFEDEGILYSPTQEEFALNRAKIMKTKRLEAFRSAVSDVLNQYLNDKKSAFSGCGQDIEVFDLRVDELNESYIAMIRGIVDVRHGAFQRDITKQLGENFTFEQRMSEMPVYIDNLHTFNREMTNCIIYCKPSSTRQVWKKIWRLFIFLFMCLMNYAMVGWAVELMDFYHNHETPIRHLYSALLLIVTKYAFVATEMNT